MKTILKISFLAVALLIGVGVNAQETSPTFGVKAGVNLSNFSGSGAEDTDAKVGFNVGVTVEYTLAPDVFLLSGLEFTTKGAKLSYLEDVVSAEVGMRLTMNAMYLQLPVHVGYKFDISENVKLNMHAGPYIAYGIGGKGKTKIEDNPTGIVLIDIDPAKSEYDFFGKHGAGRFDFGLGLGVGAEFGKIGVGLGYDLGLINISKDNNAKIRNMNAYLTVGYKF
ncbi:porin family protein [Dysgonomonas sp. Marseille-P4361]|uniref:porin family protein n=1 Tax=Dysgonomonas sp. Marseille-P4361 TaxID=2161820 RepID=UPI000D55DF4D|nr:porin family protein [Dysgonomonas sp. Marseille-P4361]